MNVFQRIRRYFERRKPGSVANIAWQKREYETELFKSGHSRKQAKTLSARRFNKADAS